MNDNDRGREQAKWQLESITEMVSNLEKARQEGNTIAEEEALRVIYEDPLTVQVRSDWVNPGDEMVMVEFEILLCTGGPACRIRGWLDEYYTPESVVLQFQDWFTPWEDYFLTEEDQVALLKYCQEFYFGR